MRTTAHENGEMRSFVSRLGALPLSATTELERSSRQILAKSLDGLARSGQATGLVIGYVQSGKTLSFTGVAASAADDDIALVIVIGGTKINLFSQSNERLKRDLNVERRANRKWKYFENPRLGEIQGIQSVVASRNRAAVDQRVGLITVAKQVDHLGHLIDILKRLDLRGTTALVVDDEADQAGLNTRVSRDEESAIYAKLTDLRRALPRHIFLQYTATPQAPLLINIIDVLSPDFAEVLEPGEDYCGGREFFLEHPDLVETIPSSEVPSPRSEPDEPPESLLRAMRLFFVGVAAGNIVDGGNGNRSMLVHPSQFVALHGSFLRWIRSARRLWMNSMRGERADWDPEVVNGFSNAHRDLKNTVPDLPGIDEILKRLPQDMADTNIQLVNSTTPSGNEVNWDNDYAHILVGGQAMDRGFTVEGLTVTYMPRGRGVGNADTIQQRARFFGYKRTYLGYCRVFLETDIIAAFREYVEHEENVRRQLIGLGDRPLKEWKRAFFLDAALRPTRSNVLDLRLVRGDYAGRWFDLNVPQAGDGREISQNRRTIREFISTLAFEKEYLYGRHQIARGVRLREVLARCLVPFEAVDGGDSAEFTGLRLQIAENLDVQPDELCDVILMNAGNARVRTVDPETLRFNLFQGRDPGRGAKIYPGDQALVDSDRAVLQLHFLDLTVGSEKYADVPDVAVKLPVRFSGSWVSQTSERVQVRRRARPVATPGP